MFLVTLKLTQLFRTFTEFQTEEDEQNVNTHSYSRKVLINEVKLGKNKQTHTQVKRMWTTGSWLMTTSCFLSVLSSPLTVRWRQTRLQALKGVFLHRFPDILSSL